PRGVSDVLLGAEHAPLAVHGAPGARSQLGSAVGDVAPAPLLFLQLSRRAPSDARRHLAAASAGRTPGGADGRGGPRPLPRRRRRQRRGRPARVARLNRGFSAATRRVFPGAEARLSCCAREPGAYYPPDAPARPRRRRALRAARRRRPGAGAHSATASRSPRAGRTWARAVHRAVASPLARSARVRATLRRAACVRAP